MKKILIVTLLIFALSGCTLNNTSTEGGITTMSEVSTEETTATEDENYIDEANIKEVNDNSYMGIELHQDSGLSEEKSKNYGMDCPYVMYPEEGDTKYYCFRYPNNEFPLTVTQISIKDSKYNVFGISIGDDITSAEGKLRDKGYEKEDNPPEGTYVYFKGDVLVFLHCKENTIERIVVSLKIEKEEGVMY
ncbi:MAG: hypothetical protein E7257_03430 [Lachnospiraceae bacterium]|nr:hypothetical protein [Lachnospiraceae bacterium]